MRYVDALNKTKKLISIEVQPPKLGENINQLYSFLNDITDLGIKFIDITYHPEQVIGYYKQQGKKFPKTTRKKPGTAGVAGAIMGRYGNKGVQPVPHVICTGFDKYSTEEYLVELAYLSVENVVALRGDNPKDKEGNSLPFPNIPGGNKHANELIEQIINLREGFYVGAEKGVPVNFCIGAACYPEKHSSTKSWKQELHWTREKVNAGADYLITQMFFDNNPYYDFIEKLKVDVPIIPGLKPLTTYNQLTVLPKIFNCEIPKKLVDLVEKHKEDKASIEKIGIDWCLEQCLDLRKNKAPSIHLYETNIKESSVKKVITLLS